ncbi:LacI family DNA-binding transcriptional regulator [Glaciecola siphonariae]|uniref:LacI family DNA-binding transcriptional regulator n=1 Tax=Glaciecola siphonariae TaxID=521012 RepID=A0ABV9LVM2_9ALTE
MSLKDVSKLLGVSTATISNAFNRPDQLSVALRSRILSECERIGYAGPSMIARSLRSGQSDVIAVMLSDSLTYSFSDPMATDFMAGITEVLAKAHKQLLLLSSTIKSDAQIRAESLPDGFIFYGAPEGDSFNRVIRSGKPLIVVDFDYPEVPSVNIDNYEACKQLASHAITNASDIPAILGMRLKHNDDHVHPLSATDLDHDKQEISWQRLFGYLAGAQQSGIEILPEHIVHLPINIMSQAEEGARYLLSQPKRPNVILCMSDIIAIAVCKVARELGLRVPEDVKVTGFDDIAEATRNQPPLTTISQQGYEKGQLAANLLLKASNERTMMDAKLVVRESA